MKIIKMRLAATTAFLLLSLAGNVRAQSPEGMDFENMDPRVLQYGLAHFQDLPPQVQEAGMEMFRRSSPEQQAVVIQQFTNLNPQQQQAAMEQFQKNRSRDDHEFGRATRRRSVAQTDGGDQ